MREIDLNYPTCPVRNVLSRMSDKWSLLILLSLSDGTKRYKDLAASIPDISQKMLTGTLKRLETDNLIARRSFPEIPPRVEYSLTDTGKSLVPALGVMIEWAKEHFTDVTV